MSSTDNGGDGTTVSSSGEVSSTSVPSHLTVSTESESTSTTNGNGAQFSPTTPSSARARRKERKRLEQQAKQKDSPHSASSSASGAPTSAFSPVGSNSNTASIQLIKPVASLPGTRSTPPIAPSSSSHSPHPSIAQNGGDPFHSQAAPPAAVQLPVVPVPAPAPVPPPAAAAAPVPAPAPIAAAPNPVSQFVSPFDNPSLNFMWPVFSPSPAAPAVVEASPPAPMMPPMQPQQQHVPAAAVVNSIPIMTAPPAVVAPSPSASYSHHPQQNHTPHHQQPYASPNYSSPSPPVGAAAYASPHAAASPAYYSSPVPPMPSMTQMTPEQTAYMQAGWAQAQYFFAQQQAAQQQQGYGPAAQHMSHQSYTPPPHANGAYYTPSATSPPAGSASAYDPSRSAPPTALPTAPYVAPSFTPISAAASPALPSSNTGFNPSKAPPGLMVLTPNSHQPVSAHSSSGKHSRRKEATSSSSADESSSDGEGDGRRSRHRHKCSRSNSSSNTSSLAPPLPHRRAVTDPASPKRAQRGVKPSSFPFPNPHDLSVEPHSANSRGPSNPASATSTPNFGHGSNGEKKKLPRWKILSPEQEERERRRAELILTERPISNRGIERNSLDSPSGSTLPPPSFGGLTPPIGKSELTRRSPSKRSSASSTPTPSGSKRDKKKGLKDSAKSSDSINEDDSKTKRRSVMIGALQNPNSDLEVSIFLTMVFVVVAAFCVLFLLR